MDGLSGCLGRPPAQYCVTNPRHGPSTMSHAAATMMKAVGSDDWTWPSDVHAAIRTLAPGHAFEVPENLFRKITDEERAEWQVRFSGVRA